MRIYFMGIGGTAMGQAALLARAAGHEVSGADTGVYPPMSTVLAAAGIPCEEGYDAARLERQRPDLVVVGNAMSRGHPEVEWLLETRALAYTSLPAFLADHVLRGRRTVVVAGTHGKTTTTALTAHLLRAGGRDPGYLIGGVPQDPPTGSHLGAAGDPFVIEGDEYDSAFFDKRSKFIHYAPRIAVLNNLEFDHADIFRDLADVQRTFLHFARLVPRNGWVLVNGDDENLRALGPLGWTRVLRVGTGPDHDLQIADFAETAAGAGFRLVWRGRTWAEIHWALPGLFNARNAAMAALAARLALVPDRAGLEEGLLLAGGGAGSTPGGWSAELATALARFRGVRRRQEVLVDTAVLKVLEDFGHHPTALAETLQALRARYPGHAIHAAFEPRSNTSRTRVMQTAFMRALAEADAVYLGPVARAEKLRPEERLDPGAVVQFLDAQGRSGHAAATNAALLELLRTHTRAPDSRPRVVVFFTNGSFDGIIGEYVRTLPPA